MINILFGCSGSGKTEYIVKKIKESVQAKKTTYLLVPDQQLFTAEHMLADMPAQAGLYFKVISFSRMCDMVFDRYGGRAYTPISSGMRSLIMWKSIKELSPVLLEYGSTPPSPEFADLMLQTADELKANSIHSDKIECILDLEMRPDLKNKLSDISALTQAYNDSLEALLGKQAVMFEDKLERLCDTLSKHNFFESSTVFVDSFTDFTGIQHRILSQIMKQADNMCISVCSPARGFKAPHTESVSDTVKRLTRAARESGKEFDDITLNGNTRTHSPQLKLLEKHLWDFSASKQTLNCSSDKMPGDIELVSCSNEYEETECAALKILQAHKNGTKYSQIAVILRHPEERSGVIDAIFSKYNIPYFISEKAQLTATPAARFILASLRCISRNYRLSDVLTLLKTGLCGIENEDADLFEEYCLTWDIQGKAFLSPVWNMNPSGYVTDTNERSKKILSAANRVRAQLITPLNELRVKFSAAGQNTAELIGALLSYMEHHQLPERLSDLAELELSLGNIKQAGEILRVYDHLLSSLSDIYTVMKDTKLSTDDFITAIEIMLSHTDISSVPSTREFVTVGSAATLRVEGIKTAIVMEMCEGVFPSVPGDGGLLCDNDKESLEDLGLTFKARRQRLMSDELFYVYRALSKPSEKLIVTTYSSGICGGSKAPSAPWRRLLSLFDITVEEFNAKAVHKLAQSQKNAQDAALLEAHKAEFFGCDNEHCETISPDVVRSVFGNELYLSKSKIQSFVRCPMLFWSNSVLDLRERTNAKLSLSESGRLIHYVLQKILEENVTSNGQLGNLSSDQVLEATDKWVNCYIDAIQCPRTPALMYAFSNLRNMAFLMAKNIFEEFENSEFRIHSFEKKISARGSDSLRSLEISLDDIQGAPTVYLGGNADRIDTYEKDGVTYIRVIDYKTGAVSFDAEKVISGADLQLPAYLFAASDEKNISAYVGAKKILPCASLYVSAVETKGDISIARSGMIYDHPDILTATNKNLDFSFISTAAEKAAQKDSSAPCPELLSKEEMDEMRDILINTVKETGTQIFSGNIRRSPSAESCRFCPVRSSCPVACKSKY
ncbi:MAG: hypothetical protein E7667_00130 [Ruminococcaceae bacterium]|nr:hypothetical protein [Oscillospiraceae bacterium]